MKTLPSPVLTRGGPGGGSPAASCEDVKQLLVRYSLGELNDDAASVVEDHVANCPRCRRLLILTRYTIAAIALDGAE